MTKSHDDWWLVADVGGTNVRFARALGDHTLVEVKRYSTANFDDFASVLKAYVRDADCDGCCMGAAVAAAGPVEDGSVRLTNLPWEISRSGLRDVLREAAGYRLDDNTIVLMNDLAAVAAGLPYLSHDEIVPIGKSGARQVSRQSMLAVNVGTWFGAACVVPFGDTWCVASSEAGHMTLVPAEAEGALAQLGGQSVEDFLSGSGVMEAYRCLSRGLADTAEIQHAGELFKRVNHDEGARQVGDLFARVLGRICGDLVLATGSWGGVYLTGSVVRSWVGVGVGDEFRRVFEDKGRMRSRMANTPTFCITLEEPALIGLARSMG